MPSAAGATPLLVEIVVLRRRADFWALRPTWEALAARAETASPFYSWIWLTTWWALFGAGKELHIFMVRAGDEVVAIAPFYRASVGPGPLRLRLLLPLGFGNELTERLDLLVAPGYRAQALAALGSYLARQRRDIWDTLIWAAVRADELPPALRRLVRADDQRPFARAQLPPSWDAFVAGLSKSMRDNIKYYPRLLKRHGHEAHVRIVTTPDEMGPAIDAFLHLHRLRARASALRPHDDKFVPSLHQRFLAQLAPVLSSEGRLRVGLVTIAGVPVAAQLTLEQGGVLTMYYSGFDPAWRAYSVGMLATAACIRDAIERGLTQVDFLQGAGQFKERWGARVEPVSRLIIVRDAPHVQLCFATYNHLQAQVVKQGRLHSRYGVGPRLRVLQRLLTLLGQPGIGS